MSPGPQPATPELLKAILNVNPNVFDQQQRNHYGNHMNTAKFNGVSPAPSYSYSHNAVPSSPSPVGAAVPSASIPNQQMLATPSQSSPHVNMGSPPSQARPGTQVNISAQNNVSPIWNNANTSNVYTNPLTNTSHPNSQNGGFYNSLSQDNTSFVNNNLEDRDPLSISPTTNDQSTMKSQKTFDDPMSISPARHQTDQPMRSMQSQDRSYEQGMYFRIPLNALYSSEILLLNKLIVSAYF